MQVKKMIQQQKEQYGWEFIFLGANMDAVETAGQFGIDADRAADYVPDGEGTALNFRMMSQAAEAFRVCGTIPPECLAKIKNDGKKRGGCR